MPANMGPWFVCPQPVARPRQALFCLPYAGRGASIYAKWRDHLPADIEVCAVQLPGRENRFFEPLEYDLLALARRISHELLPYLGVPFALFGHSLGGLLAFEVARSLRALGAAQPTHLFASARAAPHVVPQRSDLHRLADHDLLAELQRRFGPIPSAILADAELMRAYLRIIRADLAMVECYRFAAQPPLAFPIASFGGAEDAAVQADELLAWREHTRSGFSFRVFAGNHFFLNTATNAVAAAIAQELGSTP